jgi:hypothetical protein
VRLDSDGDGQPEPIRYIRFNRSTITYDDDERCVANCNAVDNAVVARGAATTARASASPAGSGPA